MTRSTSKVGTRSQSRSISKCRSQAVLEEEQNLINDKSIERHVSRIALARLKKEFQKKVEEHSVGSGKVWKNQLTQPKAPKLTGLKKRKVAYEGSIKCLNRVSPSPS